MECLCDGILYSTEQEHIPPMHMNVQRLQNHEWKKQENWNNNESKHVYSAYSVTDIVSRHLY